MNSKKNNSKLVVVILLNYNQNEYTVKCAESLLLSDYSNYKILLIDNGSNQENYQKLILGLPKDERILLKRLEKNIGYIKGINLGFAESLLLNPYYFLVMNNDTIIDQYAISELVQVSEKNQDLARVTGKVYHYDRPDELQFIGFKETKQKGNMTYERFGVNELDSGQYENEIKLDMMDDIFVLQPVKLYVKIGGYNTYFWGSGGNVDISIRAVKEGYDLIYSPKAKLWHKGSVSFGGRDMNPKMAYWSIQGKLILRYLHQSKIKFIFSYIRIWMSVLRTQIKSVYLKLFKGRNISDYANAKLKAVFYFHRWLRIKNENDGYNPY